MLRVVNPSRCRSFMKLEDMQLFVLVVETGSFTKAADYCHTPKSTISRRISQLEKDLDTRLLQRTTRKPEHDRGGRALLPARSHHSQGCGGHGERTVRGPAKRQGETGALRSDPDPGQVQAPGFGFRQYLPQIVNSSCIPPRWGSVPFWISAST